MPVRHVLNDEVAVRDIRGNYDNIIKPIIFNNNFKFLAFFDNEDGRITHVGIMLNDQQLIHASGRVRIDSIDTQGIYNTELNKYTHKLRIVKRFN